MGTKRRQPNGQKILRIPTKPDGWKDIDFIMAACNELPEELRHRYKITPEIVKKFRNWLSPKRRQDLLRLGLHYPTPEDDQDSDLNAVWRTVALLLSDKILLHKIATCPRNTGRRSDVINSYVTSSLLDHALVADVPLTILRKSDTSISINFIGALGVLVGYRTPTERIRECSVCFNLFWAKRLGTEYCDRCQWKLNKRRTRRRELKNRISSYEQELERLRLKLDKQRSATGVDHSLIQQTLVRISAVEDLLLQQATELDRKQQEEGITWLEKYQPEPLSPIRRALEGTIVPIIGVGGPI